MPSSPLSPPSWFWASGALALSWNTFGVFQFAGSVSATTESLMEMGLSAAQAQVMSSYPAWMTVAFGVGVMGGLVGSLLLLLRRRQAGPVLLASLLGYVLLYVGDVMEGVFAAMGAPQVAILTVVVAIALGTCAMAQFGNKRGLLT